MHINHQSTNDDDAPRGVGSLVLLLGLDPVQTQVWSTAAVHLGVSCVETVDDADRVAAGSHPKTTICVATAEAMTTSTAGLPAVHWLAKAPVVVLCQKPEQLVVWGNLAWEATSPPQSCDEALAILRSAQEEVARRVEAERLIAEYDRCRSSLSPVESEVLEAVCEGRLNKQIASQMRVSVRTIEQRRRKVFEKMGVDSAVPLAAMSATVRTLAQQARRCGDWAGLRRGLPPR